jgi:hypothetical protein
MSSRSPDSSLFDLNFRLVVFNIWESAREWLFPPPLFVAIGTTFAILAIIYDCSVRWRSFSDLQLALFFFLVIVAILSWYFFVSTIEARTIWPHVTPLFKDDLSLVGS